ncbi:hypothetical protein DFH06DRAFT_718094 [Mycena polygramma]|nr:hypothetical protein DFH06DRAFT_718094 [Mycena polygramma]
MSWGFIALSGAYFLTIVPMQSSSVRAIIERRTRQFFSYSGPVSQHDSCERRKLDCDHVRGCFGGDLESGRIREPIIHNGVGI